MNLFVQILDVVFKWYKDLVKDEIQDRRQACDAWPNLRYQCSANIGARSFRHLAKGGSVAVSDENYNLNLISDNSIIFKTKTGEDFSGVILDASKNFYPETDNFG